MNNTRRRLLKATAVTSFLGMRDAFSQNFPDKPIRIVVPASAGTGIDAVTRYFSEQLAKRLNQPVVIENKPGAGGLLG